MWLNIGKVVIDSEVFELVFKVEIVKFDLIENDFKLLDNDKNGYIFIEEVDDDDIVNYFGYMDSNKDKCVSCNEFISYINKYGSEVVEDDVLEMFNKS